MNDQEEYDNERQNFWSHQIPGYWGMTSAQKKNAKRRWNSEPCKKESAMNSTAHLTISAPAPVTDSDIRYSERNYLENRAYTIWNRRKTAAKRTFGLVDDEEPRNPQELVDRIKAGKFILPKEWNEHDNTCPTWFVNQIRWRDPVLVEDKEGYKTAAKVLETEFNKLTDSIKIKDPEIALTEVQAWETQ